MKKVSFLIGICVIVLSSISFATDIPKLINYQGMLTDDSGAPVTDTLDLEFKIYNAETNGDLKWSETQTDVPIVDGLFNVILGSVNPIDTLSFNEQYWLDIIVDGEQMITRLKFTSVGYAYKAVSCDVALSAPRYIVHYPNLNDAHRGSAPNQMEWHTIDKSTIVLDLSQYGGPVKVAISFCGNDKTQLRVINLSTSEGLDSTVVTGQGQSFPGEHAVVSGSFASVSETACLALQWRATEYGFAAHIQEVCMIIERLP